MRALIEIILAIAILVCYISLAFSLSSLYGLGNSNSKVNNALPTSTLPIIRDPGLKVEIIGVGLQESPISLDFIDKENILVLQKTGAVRLISNGTLHANPVLNLTVDSTLERGLLGIAINRNHDGKNQDGKDSGRSIIDVFLYFTGWNSQKLLKNMVYKYEWNGESLINPVLILELPALPGPLHNAGKLLLGSDNSLYILIGDLLRLGQLQNVKNGSGFDDTSVVIKINPYDGSPAKGNPFFGKNVTEGEDRISKYYAYGIRNSFGAAIDPVTQALWITENGPDDYDEINHVSPGFNGGWSIINGPVLRTHATYKNLVNLPGSTYTDPVFSWRKPIAVTGIDFASSILGKVYSNNIFVGDFNHGNLYFFKVSGNRTGLDVEGITGLSDLVADSDLESSNVIFGTGFGNITDVKTGPDGFLYVVDFIKDRIFKISPRTQ